jgi:hypothetical protein
MNDAELIKALRYCAEHEGCDYYIAKDCPREDTWVCGVDCEQILMLAAADALEAADEKIADYTAAIEALDDSNDAYIKENEQLKKRIAELEAQIPKRGEWKHIFGGYVECSECGASPLLDGEREYVETNYCPNCGARMRYENQTDNV